MIAAIFKDILLVSIIFIPLERLLPRQRKQKILRSQWKTDASYALVGGILISTGMLVTIALGVTILTPLIPHSLKSFVQSQHFILQFLEIIILADLGYYLIHRLFHEVPFLWRFHAIHHSIEEMDWLAARRVHPFDQIMTRGVSLILPISLEFSPAPFIAFLIFFKWHSVLKHSNVALNFGVLRWLVASPTYHHWHHANEKNAYNKNFAGQLPILDIMFGTAIMTEKNTPKRYGSDTILPEKFTDQLISPFRKVKPREITVNVSSENSSKLAS